MPVPGAYRQGLVTAITVFLAFSLAFLQYWGFEASGGWRATSIASTAIIAAGAILQLIALFRSLDLRDEDESRYRTTVRVFRWGVITVILGIVLSALFT